MLSIIPYTDNYKEAVISLILAIQAEEFGISLTRVDQPDLEEIPKVYQVAHGNFWLALVDGQLAGTIALIDLGQDQVTLRKMFVAQEYRGKEHCVAAALLTTLIGWCQQKKIQEIYLGTTAVFLAAHRFCEKNGFKEISKEELPKTFPIMNS